MVRKGERGEMGEDDNGETDIPYLAVKLPLDKDVKSTLLFIYHGIS